MVFINHTELPSIKSTNLGNTSLFFWGGGGEEVKQKLDQINFLSYLPNQLCLQTLS